MKEKTSVCCYYWFWEGSEVQEESTALFFEHEALYTFCLIGFYICVMQVI